MPCYKACHTVDNVINAFTGSVERLQMHKVELIFQSAPYRGYEPCFVPDLDCDAKFDASDDAGQLVTGVAIDGVSVDIPCGNVTVSAFGSIIVTDLRNHAELAKNANLRKIAN